MPAEKADGVASRTRRMACSALAASAFGSRTANSSPPSRANTSLARSGDHAQQLVAGGVSVAVVDELELVEVADDERDGALLAYGGVERLGAEAHEAGSVRETGQRVRLGLHAQRVDEAGGGRCDDEHGHGHQHPGGQHLREAGHGDP
jgi:hypothetical protein